MRPSAAPDRSLDIDWIEVPPGNDQLDFGSAVRDGLSGPAKSLPSQFFYDAEGSRLFEEICDLPEYYLTRAEAEILERAAPSIAARHPRIETIVELGSGSAIKTEFLLRAFLETRDDLCYAPIDVSRAALEESIERLERDHEDLEIRPALAEYEAGLAELRALDLGPTLTLWLGSSIGNLTKTDAAAFVTRVARDMQPDDRLLVGIDLRKDRATLEAAYDDAAGITARFDLNLLARINRELGADFDLDAFRHVVHYDEDSGAVKSFLESRTDQQVEIPGADLAVPFQAGERIHTEDSHKYGPDEIRALAETAGLRVEEQIRDAAGRFTVSIFACA
ncbi:MAG: L-histidine N(alpha)-methyltransferase [bacterium]|nr:L-histidine N(alpha)-methyltransferase [bacterium]